MNMPMAGLPIDTVMIQRREWGDWRWILWLISVCLVRLSSRSLYILVGQNLCRLTFQSSAKGKSLWWLPPDLLRIYRWLVFWPLLFIYFICRRCRCWEFSFGWPYFTISFWLFSTWFQYHPSMAQEWFMPGWNLRELSTSIRTFLDSDCLYL